MPTDKNFLGIGNFNQSGLSHSKWSGTANSFYKLIGFDLHSKPGVIEAAQKLSKISGSVVSEFCKVSVACSNGSKFFFSSISGKVWEVTSANEVRLVYTISASSGSSIVTGAAEYNGRIYIATSDKLHYITVANSNLNTWSSTFQANWATFTNKDPDFHTMLNHTPTQVLFIADGNYLAQVDNVTFSANAVDIVAPLRIKSLGTWGTDVLMGTYVSDSVTETQIFRWNTWDDSFTNSDPIPEVGINAFFNADNMVLAQCGKSGNIYMYNGTQLEVYKKIPGNYSLTAKAEVYPYSVANIEGQMLFGMTNTLGSPCDSLIYRIARHSREYSYIMDQPYPISERSGAEFVTSGIEIGGMCASGGYLYVAWKNGSSYGIDCLDATEKLDGAYFESTIKKGTREELTNTLHIFMAYADMPTNTDITMYLSRNYGSYVELDKRKDITTNVFISDNESSGFTTLQLKVKFTTSDNDSPLIEGGGIRTR